MAKKAQVGELFICGIGASAGGLDALTRLFNHLPEEDLNLSILVAQHLSPSHKSHLVNLLNKPSRWPVLEAQDGQEMEAGKVYITPPNKDARVNGKVITLSKPRTEIGPKPNVDELFYSIANSSKEKAIGIILTGTGRDGALGSQRIIDLGGKVLVQNPEGAAYDGMPLASLEQTKIDAQLDPEKFGDALKAIVNGEFESTEREVIDQDLAEIFDLLEKKTGVDFADYKVNTIQRRLHGRLSHLKIKDLSTYLKYINKNPNEVESLFNSVLIGVTQFFRDHDLFSELQKELQDLIQKKTDQTLRIWVAGCATGEEPYSIGILIYEILGAEFKNWNIQIFATDIDDNAIAFGRRGVYSKESLESLSQDLIDKYFVSTDRGFEVIKELRGIILFSRHDLTSNPPFLKLDLISCRNLLIYFKLDLQKKVIPIFHYALLEDGILFLGKSENLGVHSDKFAVSHKKANIYTKIYSTDLNPPRFKSLRPRLSQQGHKPRVSFEVKTIPQRVEESLYANYAHPYAVVNDNMDILYISGEVDPFMQFNQGAMTANLIKQCRKSVELVVHTTVQGAIRELEPKTSQARKLEYEGNNILYRVVCHPMLHFKDTYFMVIFESFPFDDLLFRNEEKANLDFDTFRVAELEQELDTTKEHLQSYIEELETANEEMQALNEELQSSNEELQSVNEELETSNEEMQSTNEEMQIAYQELRDVHDLLKVKELELIGQNHRLESLMDNKLQSLILVDKELQVMQFNTESENLVKSLSGKTIAEGRNLLTLLPADWTNVLRPILDNIEKDLKSSEFELYFDTDNGIDERRYFKMNFSPVIADNEISELSLSVLEISDEKNFEISLSQNQRLLNEVGKSLKVGGWQLDLASGKTKWTDEVYRIHEVESDFLTNLNQGLQFYPPEAQNELNQMIADCINEAQRFDHIFPFVTAKGNKLNVRVSGNPIIKDEKVISLWGIFHDITEQLKDQSDLEKLNADLIRSNRELEDFAYVASHDLQEPLRMVSSFNQLFYQKYKSQVDEKGEEYLEFANDGVNRMQTMLDDLLMYSRINTDKELPSQLDLNKLIDKALVNLKLYLKDHNAKVEVEADLGNIYGIESQIIRLFQNLIHNGIKFNEAKSPKVKIKRLNKKNGEFEILLSDNGIGIAPEYRDKIFSIFQRIHSREKYPGNGVGLAVCQRILNRNKGKLEILNQKAKGTTFALKFANEE